MIAKPRKCRVAGNGKAVFMALVHFQLLFFGNPERLVIVVTENERKRNIAFFEGRDHAAYRLFIILFAVAQKECHAVAFKLVAGKDDQVRLCLVKRRR